MATLVRCRCEELEAQVRHLRDEARREQQELRKDISTLWSTLLRVALAVPPPE